MFLFIPGLWASDGYPSRIRLGRDDAVVFLLGCLGRPSAGRGDDALALRGGGLGGAAAPRRWGKVGSKGVLHLEL